MFVLPSHNGIGGHLDDALAAEEAEVQASKQHHPSRAFVEQFCGVCDKWTGNSECGPCDGYEGWRDTHGF